jgi:hypothetical protein
MEAHQQQYQHEDLLLDLKSNAETPPAKTHRTGSKATPNAKQEEHSEHF